MGFGLGIGLEVWQACLKETEVEGCFRDSILAKNWSSFTVFCTFCFYMFDNFSVE